MFKLKLISVFATSFWEDFKKVFKIYYAQKTQKRKNR